MTKTCILIGAPLDCGQRTAGCLMGPAAYRVAGIERMLAKLGLAVEDRGDIRPALWAAPRGVPASPNRSFDLLYSIILDRAAAMRTERAFAAAAFCRPNATAA